MTSIETPEILDRFEHYFHDHTCLNCQTEECNLRFNCMYFVDESKPPQLINYWLKWKGYTAVIGVSNQYTEVTEDWHTSENAHTRTTTMCHMIFKSETVSAHITPYNFPDKLKMFKVFL